ncbi:phosphodiester glycosidase family protein [Streptomyces aureus]|uniref:phosphodiester glycosidase family protein n=1 Tax=Streptomyces aureus TaxID=193461 RepID=UPI003615AEC6
MRRRTAVVALAMTLAACGAPTGDRTDGAGPPTAAARTAELPSGVTYQRSTRTLADGEPVRVHVLSVAPDSRATVTAVHGRTLAGTSTVRQLAAGAGAAAAVNGTFFDVHTGEHHGGYEGDPLGIYGTDGRLLSEAANGSTALVLGGGRPRVTELRSATSVLSSDGARRTVDGIDRRPGRILGCGGVSGDVLAGTDRLVTAPRHGELCVDDSELTDFRPQWGPLSPAAEPGSAEAVLDAHGTVTRLRSPAGGSIPADGRTLVGTGGAARWLRDHARVGHSLKVTNRVTDPRGVVVGGRGVSFVGAGPALVRGGHVWINARANGYPASALTTRHPRTVAGVTADGTLLLVVLDGRWPGTSVGATFAETARIMVSLGAVDAVNLDGGGSSTAVVDGQVRNRPSGGHGSGPGERKVSNAIVIVPER